MRKAIVIGFLSLLLGNLNVYGEGVSDENPVSGSELEYQEPEVVNENLDSNKNLNNNELTETPTETSDLGSKLRYKEPKISDENSEYHEGYPFSHWAVGINVGLYGYGLEVNTHLIPNIKLRLGFNYFGYTFSRLKFDYEFDEKANGYFIEREGTAELTPKIGFVNGKVLFDILPFETGKFAFTTGVYIGKNGLTVNGITYDRNSGRPIDTPIYFDDGIVIYPDSKGNVDATLRMGNIVKPYFGLTFGRAIPRRSVGFKFEMGVIYQGNLKLESNSTGNSAAVDRANDELNSGMNELPNTIQNLLKLWPMMQFQLTYKIK